MVFKKKEFFLLIFLIFLQSCSGGRIGNFLESSFNDLEKTSQDEDFQNSSEKTSQDEDSQNNSENNEFISKENKKYTHLEEEEKSNNNEIKNYSKNRKIELQSYKIIFILKDVDPKDPIEELNTILINSEVNFEIEKIERILDPKNKSMNKNN